MSEVRLKGIQALLLWLNEDSGLDTNSIGHIFETAKGNIISIWNSCRNAGMTLDDYEKKLDILF